MFVVNVLLFVCEGVVVFVKLYVYECEVYWLLKEDVVSVLLVNELVKEMLVMEVLNEVFGVFGGGVFDRMLMKL